MFPIANADVIFAAVDQAFGLHESHREPSVEFKQPGPSPWRHAQKWAQAAVDRPAGAPLPPYEPGYDPEPPTDHLSFALGRFGANGEGILDVEAEPRPPGSGLEQRRTPPLPGGRGSHGKDDLTHALPAGILFLDGTLDSHDHRDGQGHPAAKPLLDAWDTYGADIAPRSSLREYLRENFFETVHRKMYESRPIHWPMSSEKKTFVAWITIHRWTESTLRVLLADHLRPTLTRLEGELTDLRTARECADKKAAKAAEKRYTDVKKWSEELAAFIKLVQQCAEKGPPPTDVACPHREVDARYVPDLDDGVMINSAALWPLLSPQWKEPKKWWKELAAAKGKKEYDWSHLAMRYWPTRVDSKCQQDPSLGVAHGCFWKYHPARAWAWELRLQDEIGPEFRIGEAPYRGDGGDTVHRAAYLRDHAAEALATIEKEVIRRRRKQKKREQSQRFPRASSEGTDVSPPPDSAVVQSHGFHRASSEGTGLPSPPPSLLGGATDSALQASLQILEPGLWSTVPDLCWDLESRVIEKQGVPFLLLAPDEPAARKAFEVANAEKVIERAKLLAGLKPPNLFDDAEDEPSSDDEDQDEAGELQEEEVGE